MKSTDLELIADIKKRKLGRVAGYEILKDQLNISYEEFASIYRIIGYSDQEFYEAEDLHQLMGVNRKWVVSHKELRPLCVGGAVLVGSKSLRKCILEFPGEILPYQSRLNFLWFLSIINPIVGS